MFGRRKNRKRRSLRERLRDWFDSTVEFGRRVGPYVVLAVVAVTIPYLVLTGYRRVTSSPYFDISDIDIQGASHAEVHRLAERAELVHGTNIFDVDPTAASKVFETSPWIERASVDRRLPDEIVVDLDELEPGALLVGSETHVVSTEGRPIEPVDIGTGGEFFELPMVTGLSLEDLQGKEGRSLMREALRVSELYASMGLGDGGQLSEIHVDPVVGLTLTVEGTATQIRLGRGKYRRRLERLRTVRETLAERDVEPAYILMDHDDSLERITVGRRQRHGERRAGARE